MKARAIISVGVTTVVVGSVIGSYAGWRLAHRKTMMLDSSHVISSLVTGTALLKLLDAGRFECARFVVFEDLKSTHAISGPGLKVYDLSEKTSQRLADAMTEASAVLKHTAPIKEQPCALP